MGIKSEQCVYCGESSAWPRDQAVKTKLARSKREREIGLGWSGVKYQIIPTSFLRLLRLALPGL